MKASIFSYFFSLFSVKIWDNKLMKVLHSSKDLNFNVFAWRKKTITHKRVVHQRKKLNRFHIFCITQKLVESPWDPIEIQNSFSNAQKKVWKKKKQYFGVILKCKQNDSDNLRFQCMMAKQNCGYDDYRSNFCFAENRDPFCCL